MQSDDENFEFLELTSMLINTNRRFTNALKARKPHEELIEIYAQIEELCSQIHTLKRKGLAAA
jgi:hypothetical protein